MPFGKHIGVSLCDLPDDYLAWLRRSAAIRYEALGDAVEEEYYRRLRGETHLWEDGAEDFTHDDLKSFLEG